MLAEVAKETLVGFFNNLPWCLIFFFLNHAQYYFFKKETNFKDKNKMHGEDSGRPNLA